MGGFDFYKLKGLMGKISKPFRKTHEYIWCSVHASDWDTSGKTRIEYLNLALKSLPRKVDGHERISKKIDHYLLTIAEQLGEIALGG